MMPPMAAPPLGPILVVDDDPKIVALVRTYLERERYPVVTAADGRAALRAIEQLMPRLVVLDLMLPEIDGLSVIRRARAAGRVPILVLSARGSVGDRILGLSEGADDYLPEALLAGRARRAGPDDPAPDRAPFGDALGSMSSSSAATWASMRTATRRASPASPSP